MTTRFHLVFTLVALAGLAVCAKGDDQRENADTAAAQGRPGMKGMQGMQGMSMDTVMMSEMRSHMRMMTGAGADSMPAMLPMHRQMVANMISQMDREMRSMNMPASAEWRALIDSLRQDNVRMPDMSAAELRSFMPRHGARVMRLMEMHRSMMANMKM